MLASNSNLAQLMLLNNLKGFKRYQVFYLQQTMNILYYEQCSFFHYAKVFLQLKISENLLKA